MAPLEQESIGAGSSRQRRQNALGAFFFLLIAVGLAYCNSLEAIWTIDDDPNILQNPQVHIGDLRPLTLFQTFFSPLHPDENGQPGLSRPLAHLSFAINWYFGKDSPAGYRLVNILLHFLTASVLFLVIRALLQAPNLRGKYHGRENHIALLGAALWALNPIQTQAVVYIVQRMASLASFFYLLSIWAYIRAKTSQKSTRRITFLLLTAASFLAGVGSKENAVLLPAALVLLEFIFFQDGSSSDGRRRFGYVMGFSLGLLVICCGIILSLEKLSNLLDYSIRLFTPWERLLTQARIVFFYLSQIFYPIPSRLSIVHDVQLSRSLIDPWTTLPAVLGVLGIVGFGFWQLRKRPMLSFAILFFFLNHVIESSIIGLELLYEHRNYLPSLFLFAPVAIGLQYLADHFRVQRSGFHRVVSTFVFLLVVGFGAGTYIRNLAWLDHKIFWEDAAEKAPLSMRPLHNLAYYHYEKTGQHQKAFDLYHEALGRQDTNRLMLSLPHIKIAEHYERQGDFIRAGEHLEKALAIFPEFEQMQVRLAIVHYKAAHFDMALAAIAPIVEKRPGSFDCRYLMGQIFLKMSRMEEALRQFEKALRLSPDSENVLFMTGITLNLSGRCNHAERFLERVLERFPSDKHALLWMIDCRLQASDTAAADGYARKFLEGIPADRIEEEMRQTLAGGFMPEAAQERLLRWISFQAHFTWASETGGGAGRDSSNARDQGSGS